MPQNSNRSQQFNLQGCFRKYSGSWKELLSDNIALDQNCITKKGCFYWSDVYCGLNLVLSLQRLAG